MASLRHTRLQLSKLGLVYSPDGDIPRSEETAARAGTLWRRRHWRSMHRPVGHQADQCRILIVEDDPLISSHLETIVSQTIDESDVVVRASVAEALDALRAPIDFALLDVDVLDGTTYAFASRLSSQDIPFAFLSASNREQVPHALKDAPFVAKPYTAEDIVELIQSAGRGSGAPV